jgi:hypothetical protein
MVGFRSRAVRQHRVADGGFGLGDQLVFSPDEWTAFIKGVKGGGFDVVK